jgi:GalNAc-alpha-(1->4)-GalNAc-alpha-(1->3)-diNAcBac-PP-undecaprenol alpha-1,4-N-acetyl-D-galactosaminyltransferase
MTVNKLAFVIHSLQPGGMERVMSELASSLSADPFTEVHLVMYGRKPELFYVVDKRVVIHMPQEVFDNKRRIRSTIRRMKFLRRVIGEIRPSAVLSFGEFWNSMVLLALMFSGNRVFVSDRCQPDKKMSFTQGVMRRILYPLAEGIIAQTAKAKDIIEREIRHGNVRVIGNPIRLIEDPGVPKRDVVLSVGRLIASKHHDQLIRIFSRVVHGDWKLVIVGGDALRQENMKRLNALVDDLGMQERIILAGNRNDVDEYYLTSSIFAFTSSSEGFPNVIGEAMSAGLPVVAYDCTAGPSEMIRNGENGFLVDLFDEEDFSKKLKSLMDDRSLRTKLGESAKKSITRYHVGSVSMAYKDFLLEH